MSEDISYIIEGLRGLAVAIDSYNLDPENARSHSRRNIDSIKASLSKFGQRKPIVINKVTNNLEAGEGTTIAAKELGWKYIAAVYVEDDETTAVGYALSDNRTAELAEWNPDVLSGALAFLESSEELDDSWWTSEEMKNVLSKVNLDGEEGEAPPVPNSGEPREPGAGGDDFDPEEVKGPPLSQPGDVWQLGEHRLAVGDSTDPDTYSRLMKGDKADLVFTDPPYNIDYTGKSKEAMKIQNDSMDDSAFKEFLLKFYTAAFEVTKEGGPIYVCHAGTEGANFMNALKEAGWLLKQLLIWVKQRPCFGRQDYHWMHEPILYGWKPGAAHPWYADRKQTTVWNFDKPTKSELHPCLSPDSLVMTEQGYRPISELSTEDKVYGHDGKFHNILEVSSHDYNEPIYRIGVTGTNLTVDATHNHPFLVMRKKRFKETKIGFTESSEMKVGDYILTPLLNTENGSCPYSLTECFLFGLFLAEGSFQNAGHGNNFYPGFSLNKNEVHLIEKIRELNSEKTYVYADKNSDGIDVKVFDPVWGQRFLDLCGKGASTKSLDPSVFNWDKESIKSLVEGYVAGDGNTNRGRDYFSAKTVSPHIVSQIQVLADSVGYRTSFYVRNDSQGKGIGNRKFIKTLPYYQMYIDPVKENHRLTSCRIIEWEGIKYFARRVKSIKLRPYDNLVWNLTVEGSQTFQTVIGMSHNTTKPIELVEYALNNSSQVGDIVLDCFGGSGSTLIACHRQNRKARLIELDPKYADVILQRFLAETGDSIQPILIEREGKAVNIEIKNVDVNELAIKEDDDPETKVDKFDLMAKEIFEKV